MKEELLHYIWKYQLFDKTDLRTSDGQALNIIRPGYHNTNAGPDFSQAQIHINNMQWFGAVEIHTDARDWDRHRHQFDQAYEQVILHVVWEADKDVKRKDGTFIPSLSLGKRIDHRLLRQYRSLMETGLKNRLACAESAGQVSQISKLSALERAATARLERKSREVIGLCEESGLDWQQAAFRWLCRAFGFKVNAEAFLFMSRDIPYAVLLKHRSSLEQVCSLLLGAAGLLEYSGERQAAYKREFDHLRHKFGLRVNPGNYGVRRGRLRPANLPELRIIQLSALLVAHPDVCRLMMDHSTLPEVEAVFKKARKLLSETGNKMLKPMGRQSEWHLIINAFITMKFAYGMYQDRPDKCEEALQLLQDIPAENNRYTKMYTGLDFPLESALESQGALELYASSCSESACLRCPVGVAILGNQPKSLEKAKGEDL